MDQQQLTVKQFGARAASYLNSTVHSKGADLDRLNELVRKKKPACVLCPLSDDCLARARGDQETFPRKAPKKSGTLRRGAAFRNCLRVTAMLVVQPCTMKL